MMEGRNHLCDADPVLSLSNLTRPEKSYLYDIRIPPEDPAGRDPLLSSRPSGPTVVGPVQVGTGPVGIDNHLFEIIVGGEE